jgi:hypothetical protein
MSNRLEYYNYAGDRMDADWYKRNMSCPIGGYNCL